MQQHNQLQVYVGLEEGGCVDVATIKLDGYTLVSTAELRKLEQQANPFKLNCATAQAAALNNLVTKMQERATLYLQPNGESDASFISYILGMLDGPEQRVAQSVSAAVCFNNIQADAIVMANNEMLFNIAKSYGTEDCAYMVKEHLERLADAVRSMP